MPAVQNGDYHTQPGTYSLEVEARPKTASSDMLIALAKGPQTSWQKLAAIVRLNTNNAIDVRDGDVYRADTVMPYVAGEHYVVRSTFIKGSDGRPNRYNVSVNGTAIARDYRLRAGLDYLEQVTNWTAEAEVGPIRACYVYTDTHLKRDPQECGAPAPHACFSVRSTPLRKRAMLAQDLFGSPPSLH